MTISNYTRRCLTTALLCTAAAAAVHAAAPQPQRGWEPLKAERTDAKPVVKETEVEILSLRGAIIVTVARQSDIKVYSIIGRQVSADTLPPGTHQLQLPAHGVYIVKVGELTCKVAV